MRRLARGLGPQRGERGLEEGGSEGQVSVR